MHSGTHFLELHYSGPYNKHGRRHPIQHAVVPWHKNSSAHSQELHHCRLVNQDGQRHQSPHASVPVELILLHMHRSYAFQGKTIKMTKGAKSQRSLVLQKSHFVSPAKKNRSYHSLHTHMIECTFSACLRVNKFQFTWMGVASSKAGQSRWMKTPSPSMPWDRLNKYWCTCMGVTLSKAGQSRWPKAPNPRDSLILGCINSGAGVTSYYAGKQGG